jgi:cytochrome oxidase assembly protein ShyY1
MAQIAALGGKRPVTSTAILLTTILVTFNGGIWQLFRRRQKQQLVDSFDNMKKAELTAENLPGPGQPFGEFYRVSLDGKMDNEGGVLVGPRPMPASRQAMENQQESRRGGFMLLTPFEVEKTGRVIMVNRGWVPIDACKSRLQRVQYSGEGVVPYHLEGVIRKEEWLQTSFGGDSAENHKPAYLDKFWSAVRPFDIIKDYFKKRYGEENVDKCIEKCGAYHWFVEMVENHSGDDQILVGDKAYPVRRTASDLTRTNLSPAVHLMYAMFWFFVSAGCTVIMRRMWLDRIKIGKATRIASQAAEVLASKRRAEASRLESELSKLTEAVNQGKMHELRMSAVKSLDEMNTTKSGHEVRDNMEKEAMGVVKSASPYSPPSYRNFNNNSPPSFQSQQNTFTSNNNAQATATSNASNIGSGEKLDAEGKSTTKK